MVFVCIFRPEQYPRSVRPHSPLLIYTPEHRTVKKNQFVYLYTINHCDETSTVVIKETTNFLSIALRIHFMKKSRFHFFLLYCDNQRRRMICCPTWRGRGSWAYVRCASQIARGRGSPGCEPGLQTIRKMIG